MIFIFFMEKLILDLFALIISPLHIYIYNCIYIVEIMLKLLTNCINNNIIQRVLFILLQHVAAEYKRFVHLTVACII